MRFTSENELSEWITAAEHLWLFLDYDGTLAAFTRTPDIISPNPRIIELVRRLAGSSRVRLAIVSGRCMRDLQVLLPVPGIFLAGTYGIEI